MKIVCCSESIWQMSPTPDAAATFPLSPRSESQGGDAASPRSSFLLWWDTHSENVQETAKRKVSHLSSNALISHQGESPLGDAIGSSNRLVRAWAAGRPRERGYPGGDSRDALGNPRSVGDAACNSERSGPARGSPIRRIRLLLHPRMLWGSSRSRTALLLDHNGPLENPIDQGSREGRAGHRR
jgi:hypothetical protein